MKKSMLLVALLSLTACAEPLVGKSAVRVVQYAGPPVTSTALPNGMTVHRWDDRWTGVYGQYWCRASLTVDASNLVVAENYAGDGCGPLRARMSR